MSTTTSSSAQQSHRGRDLAAGGTSTSGGGASSSSAATKSLVSANAIQPATGGAVAAPSDGEDRPPLFSAASMGQARAILAAAGYPDPSLADVEAVLLQARQNTQMSKSTNSSGDGGVHRDGKLQQQQEQEQAQQRPSFDERHAGVRFTEGVDAAPPPQGPARTLEPPRRPDWNHSTRLDEIGDNPFTTATTNAAAAASPYATNGRRHPFDGRGLPAPPPRSARSPGAYLQPTARLERYVAHYERALRQFYRSHPGLFDESSGAAATSGDPNASYDSARAAENPSSGLRGAGRHAPYPTREVHTVREGQPIHVLSVPLNRSSRRSNAATAATYTEDPAARRAANVIYANTGDQRYRFNLLEHYHNESRDGLLSGAQGSTTANTVATSNSNVAGKATASTSRATGRASHSGGLTALQQLERQPQVFATDYNPRTADRQSGRVLSTYRVSYLGADGSTLRRRADPVARGQQMREYWSRDTFLEKQTKSKPLAGVKAATTSSKR